METQPSQFLLVHGAVVFILGLLAGVPFWIAIIYGRASKVVRAWRVAHATLIACGLSMLVVGLVSPYLVLSGRLVKFLEWAFVVSGYSFAFALVVGAATSHRALTPAPPMVSRILFVGHLIGGACSTMGAFILLYGLIQEV